MTPSEHDHDHDHNHHGESGDATCPVCEMTVDSATSPSRAHLGKKYLSVTSRARAPSIKSRTNTRTPDRTDAAVAKLG